MQYRSYVFGRLLRNQTPEEGAVAFSRCPTFANRLAEFESDSTGRLDCRGHADRADTSTRHHKNLIQFLVVIKVESADHRTKADGHPVDAGNIHSSDCVGEVQTVFIGKHALSRRSG